MIGASKILTVSYGTFSCTLEGFDDPFNTMKAIAEYFRDLAAEDRYFGAEPPTPDTAMLHRIAEREVHRRVDARVQDNRVILRVGEDVPAVVEPAASPPEVNAKEAPVARPAEPVVADLDTATGGSAPATTVPTLNPMPEGVVARLAKIRAAVALADPDVVSTAAVTLSDFAEDQHADEAFAPFTDDSAAAVFDLDDADEPVDVDVDAAMIVALSVGEDPIATDVPEEPAVADTADEALFADVMDDEANDPIADFPVQDVADSQDAPADTETDDDMLADLAALDTPIDAPVDATGDADVVDAMTAEHDDYDGGDSTLLANIMTDATPEDIEAVALEGLIEDAAPQDALIEPEEDGAADIWSDAADTPAELTTVDVSDDAPADDAPLDDTRVENLALDDAPLADADLPEVMMADMDSPAADVEPTPAAAAPETDQSMVWENAQSARSRVIRVRRSVEIALDRHAPETIPVEMIAETASSVLPDDAETELQRELAALEADDATRLADAADDDLQRQLADVFNDTAETVSDADADPHQLAGLAADNAHASETAREPGVEEDAVRRLMDQTQSEMAVPENRRRLSSISHLKAAVAATIAERFGSKLKPVEEVEATRTEPYRNDLAHAVRPAQQMDADDQNERPTPLVLVSEQRIDQPAADAPAVTVTPARPRQVTMQGAALQSAFEGGLEDEADLDTDTDNIFGDANGFAEFADRVGAQGLLDLLEAAAAYAAAVEGRDTFTRPQLLRQIATLFGGDVTREDELRSFGALLRDGRIVKVKRGEFALADTSRMLIEARKIAG
jgi:hypothetical protein